MKRLRDATLAGNRRATTILASFLTPSSFVAVGDVAPAVTQQPVATATRRAARGRLLGDAHVTSIAQRSIGVPLAFTDDRRVTPCIRSAKPGASDSHDTGALARGLRHGSSPWAPAAAYVAAGNTIRQPRRLTLVSRKGFGMSRLAPLTSEVVTAISDGARALNMVFLSDGVIDQREMDVIRGFRHAQAIALRADWSRRARQSIENAGEINARLEREYREIEAEFAPDAA